MKTFYGNGNNLYGQLGIIYDSYIPTKVLDTADFKNKNIISVAIGSGIAAFVQFYNNKYILYTTGLLLSENNRIYNKSPVKVASTNGFINDSTIPISAVCCGDTHCVFIQGGVVYTFGYNEFGQLGNRTNTNSSVPVKVVNNGGFINNAVSNVSCGYLNTAVIKNGIVYTFGLNIFGQLGNGTTVDSNFPVKVVDNDGFINNAVNNVSCGLLHTAVIQSGVVYTFGYNIVGQLGNRTNTTSSVPVKVVDNDGFTNNNLSSVSCGSYHTGVIKNGIVYTFGYNEYGQLGNSTNINSNVAVRVVDYGNIFVNNNITDLICGLNYSSIIYNNRLYVFGQNTVNNFGQNTISTNCIYSFKEYNTPQYSTIGSYYNIIAPFYIVYDTTTTITIEAFIEFGSSLIYTLKYANGNTFGQPFTGARGQKYNITDIFNEQEDTQMYLYDNLGNNLASVAIRVNSFTIVPPPIVTYNKLTTITVNASVSFNPELTYTLKYSNGVIFGTPFTGIIGNKYEVTDIFKEWPTSTISLYDNLGNKLASVFIRVRSNIPMMAVTIKLP
jgi:alpha-tubulin suppressor-like RCC1 family protein